MQSTAFDRRRSTLADTEAPVTRTLPRPSTRLPIWGFLIPALLAPPMAGAQQAPPRPTCAGPEHRQFDFWVGDWRVESPDGRFLGTNRIVRRFGGCVLQEHWEGAAGGLGESYNLYDRNTGLWHQRWVSSTGNLLELDGGLRDGAMVMEGETLGRDGSRSLNRITWTPLGGAPGRVRQLWEASTDGGATWSVAFDGIYIREG